ncbi:MAG: tetratricopeptide repeat protein [Paludibacteraceae bacterium]|nr:tetratricopeptide repeat protein [Paludibacteraceae bacterium]
MAKKTQKQDEQLENVQEALSTSGKWIEDNQNLISWVILGILVVAVGIWLINAYVIKPKRVAADNENAIAMTYFMQKDYEVALSGNDECMGFAAIADKYSNKGGELARFCAGECCYHLGRYDEAIEYLKSYKTKDLNYAAASKQLLGDAYVQIDDTENAIKCFAQVGEMGHDILSPKSLLKEAVVYESLEQHDKALKVYQTIIEKYPNSEEANTASLYVVR